MIHSPSAAVAALNSETTVRVYPNPSKGSVTISSPGANVERIDVYTALGVLVRTEEHPSPNGALDLSSFENGIYIVAVKTNKGIVNKRITINR